MDFVPLFVRLFVRLWKPIGIRCVFIFPNCCWFCFSSRVLCIVSLYAAHWPPEFSCVKNSTLLVLSTLFFRLLFSFWRARYRERFKSFPIHNIFFSTHRIVSHTKKKNLLLLHSIVTLYSVDNDGNVIDKYKWNTQ